ncbi:SOS response-associated peptidase [Massilia endophytica]|uniref:SOS response-associated peptidase n=1 Tax=Massilia endophytica TaxID=2899220 RepID=UPI001E65229B|nr:SOS response-associated peptidase family protein [Massilia endophytica]UGQ44951.1 SOS response-associated peptidase [Massilia endophytica]
MCGRIDQSDLDDLLSDFSWADEAYRRSRAEPCWNVAPTMRRAVLHVEGGALALDDLHWGYQAAWAVGKVPMAINAKLEKITGKYWSGLLKRGRVIMPANGWYEWTGEKPNKQPWHIHRADGHLLYLAGLASFGPEGEIQAANGFTLITADAHGGMIDIHDRRPIVFTAADAATWLDPATPPELAEQLARECALGPEYFAWHKVDRAVGNVRNQGSQLALPI